MGHKSEYERRNEKSPDATSDVLNAQSKEWTIHVQRRRVRHVEQRVPDYDPKSGCQSDCDQRSRMTHPREHHGMHCKGYDDRANDDEDVFSKRDDIHPMFIDAWPYVIGAE